jgi:hypothetical protein
MKKTFLNDQRGLALIPELIFIAVVVGVLGFVGFRVYQAKQAKPVENGQKIAGLAEEFRYGGVAVPEDWKDYTNTEYGFGFSYPSNYVVTGTNIESGKSADKAIYDVSVSNQADHGGYSVRVLKTSLDVAVKDYADTFQEKPFRQTVKITDISLDGHKGKKFTYEPDGDRIAFFFVERDGLVYFFEVVTEVRTSLPDEVLQSMRVYNSLWLGR